MLPKLHRLRFADFKGLRGARALHSPHFFLRVGRTSSASPARVAAVVPKASEKTAPARNRLRRRIYALLDSLARSRAGFSVAVTAKTGAGTLSFEEAGRELSALLRRASVR